MADLGEYLREAGLKRRQAGQHDCCTFPADWAIANGWPDPMAQWRGVYATEEEALALISEAGGLAALFDIGMAGIPLAGHPQAGDIGVIDVLGNDAGAIFSGRRWAMVADRGIACASLMPSMVVRCWRPVRG